MPPRLLETKFHLPSPQPGEVVRARLTDELNAGLANGRKLTLVSAPAGYGKTTLAAGWLAALGKNVSAAWLSLDDGDNDPARFALYFTAAFQRQAGEAATGALRLVENSSPPDPQGWLDELINGLAASPARLALTLDDYHVITNPKVHAALEYFIGRQPEGVHLIITTREDPPLPLARLRARGQMTEIRAYDLRFTAVEATEFFRQAMKLDLDAEVVGCLEDRTEGWAAGLQLAALSLRNMSDPRAFVKTFRGSNRFILDYLAEEVIRQQEEDVRDFLAATCILERMNAPVCQALTGREDSQELLNRLEQANLFIIPLDDERNWYRYHHLFADFLQAGLSDADAAALYHKAAGWHEDNGYIFEAVRYALAGRDNDFTAGMMERILNNQAAWSGGQVATLAGWMDRLPPEVLSRRPMLSLHASRIMYLCSRNDAAERLITQAEESLAALQNLPPLERDRIAAHISLYRGGMAAMRGEVEKAVALTESSLAGLPEEDLLARARASFSLGLALDLKGEMERSEQAYLRTAELARAAGVLFLAVNVHGSLALAWITRGSPSRAELICRQAVEIAGSDVFGPLGLIWSILGSIALERDELDKAEELIHAGMELSRKSGLQEDVVTGKVFLARLRCAQGDAAAALAEAEQVCAIIDAFGIERLSMQASALLARLQLAAGRMEPAQTWARRYRIWRDHSAAEYLLEFEDLILARVLAFSGDRKAALDTLTPVLAAARSGGRSGTCLDALILLTIIHQTAGERQAAVQSLDEAVRLAAPENCLRRLIDEGPALLELLPRVKEAAPDFVAGLMERISSGLPPSPAGGLAAFLPDPLSAQEERVLRLIVAGMSNREIADELVISLGTAKWHVHHVLQKLGAGSRPQAIARARELGF